MVSRRVLEIQLETAREIHAKARAKLADAEAWANRAYEVELDIKRQLASLDNASDLLPEVGGSYPGTTVETICDECGEPRKSMLHADDHDFVYNASDSRLRDLLKTPEGREQAIAEGLVRQHNNSHEGNE